MRLVIIMKTKFRKYKKAIVYFDRAVELKPNNAGYKLTRGRILMRLKRHKEAQSDLQFALEAGNPLSAKPLEINSEVLQNKISSGKANRKIREMLLENARRR